jgi:hypothetical protein
MALTELQNDAILAGVASADTLFYGIGGAILIVIAGMWGFNRVVELLGFKAPNLSGGRSDADGFDDVNDGSESIFNSSDAPTLGGREYLSDPSNSEDWGADTVLDRKTW